MQPSRARRLSATSLSASPVIPSRTRARPAIALERLAVDGAGRVVLELTHPLRDGTTHVLFSPEDWLARLAALVPRPRAHLTRYRGVFAPNCRLRPRVVPSPAGTAVRKRQRCTAREASSRATPPALNDDGLPIAPMTWAQRLRRVFHRSLGDRHRHHHLPRLRRPTALDRELIAQQSA